jgi:hypothetical protein
MTMPRITGEDQERMGDRLMREFTSGVADALKNGKMPMSRASLSSYIKEIWNYWCGAEGDDYRSRTGWPTDEMLRETFEFVLEKKGTPEQKRDYRAMKSKAPDPNEQFDESELQRLDPEVLRKFLVDHPGGTAKIIVDGSEWFVLKSAPSKDGIMVTANHVGNSPLGPVGGVDEISWYVASDHPKFNINQHNRALSILTDHAKKSGSNIRMSMEPGTRMGRFIRSGWREMMRKGVDEAWQGYSDPDQIEGHRRRMGKLMKKGMNRKDASDAAYAKSGRRPKPEPEKVEEVGAAEAQASKKIITQIPQSVIDQSGKKVPHYAVFAIDGNQRRVLDVGTDLKAMAQEHGLKAEDVVKLKFPQNGPQTKAVPPTIDLKQTSPGVYEGKQRSPSGAALAKNRRAFGKAGPMKDKKKEDSKTKGRKKPSKEDMHEALLSRLMYEYGSADYVAEALLHEHQGEQLVEVTAYAASSERYRDVALYVDQMLRQDLSDLERLKQLTRR